ncbi:MAG: type II secretion system F family protein [bacterium]
MAKTFNFTARGPGGKTFQRTMDADSPQTVIDALRRQGYWVVKIREKKAAKGVGFFDRMRGVGLKTLTIFSRQFALLISAGLTLANALDVIEEQTQDSLMKKIVHQLKTDVESGETLARSMKKFPRSFSNFFCSMVHAGEVGGAIEAILERMATFFEKELDLRHKIRSAMAYPIFVTVIAFLITMGILLYIVPQFANLYESLSEGDVALPALTQKLVDISDFVVMNWWWAIPCPFFAGMLFWQFRKSRWGHRLLDPIFIRLPVVGSLSKKVAVSRFSRTLGTLTQSGVPILEALEVVSETADNYVVTRSLHYIHDRVREGEPIAGAMKTTGIFPPMVYHMVAVGEEAGNLENMLYKLSDFYDVEIDATIKGMASLIEPLMIILIGSIVGVIVVALYLPIFQIVDLFK